MPGRIAVDLDGTLAEYHRWNPDGSVGKPIPKMVDRVKKWLADGKQVVIFTARVSMGGGYSTDSKKRADEKFVSEQREIIEAWCKEHLGQVLPITSDKSFDIYEFWDDRAKQVYPNTGETLEDTIKKLTDTSK